MSMRWMCEMKLVLLIAIGFMAALNPSRMLAQVPLPLEITAEPHYRLLLGNEHVRVFGVTIPPHEQAYAKHTYNLLIISVMDAEVVMWSGEEAAIMSVPLRAGDVRFLFGGTARGIRNDSDREYRNITLEFLDPGVTTYGFHYYTGLWDFGSFIMAPPVDPQAAFISTLPLGMAEAKDVQLLPGDVLSPPQEVMKELLVPITTVSLKAGEDENINCVPGEVLWLGIRNSGLMNRGSRPARLVVVAFRSVQ